MLFADNTYKINICAWIHLQCYSLVETPCFPHWFTSFPPFWMHQPPFLLTWEPSFGDRGANVHPLSSLVSDQLFTPCFLNLPNPSQQHPWFMLNVYRDDITTSATLFDTCTVLCSLCSKHQNIITNYYIIQYDAYIKYYTGVPLSVLSTALHSLSYSSIYISEAHTGFVLLVKSSKSTKFDMLCPLAVLRIRFLFYCSYKLLYVYTNNFF